MKIFLFLLVLFSLAHLCGGNTWELIKNSQGENNNNEEGERNG